MFTKRNQKAKIFVDVTYKYDVDVQVIIGIIAHNSYNTPRGNK